ncbi:hypothetical protein AAHS21_26500 [Mycobacterium sp. 050272]|uniref:hypothetical protein n=1 Tax=Mycobacterium sp. 050272 TaxID=3142488 RepID=UPI003186F090
MTCQEGSESRLDQLRQLAIECLNDYGGGFAEVEKLDRDLKSIIRTLTDLDDAPWTESLLRQWGQLEIIDALALTEGRFELSEEEENDVREIIADLITEFQNGGCASR